MYPGAFHEEFPLLIGLLGTQYSQQLTTLQPNMRQAWSQTWNVNTVGTQIVTHTFIPLLLESANPRILFITSGASSLKGTENLDLLMNRVFPKGWPKMGMGAQSNVSAYRKFSVHNRLIRRMLILSLAGSSKAGTNMVGIAYRSIGQLH